MLHGPPGRQVLTLAHERFFVPTGPRPPAPDVRPVLADIRRAVATGDAGAASELLTAAIRASGYPDGLIWTDPLGICATLTLRTGGAADASLEREVDLVHGEVATLWDDEAGGRCVLRVVAPRDEPAVLVRLETERDLAVTWHLALGGAQETALDTGVPDGSTAIRVDLAAGLDGRLRAVTADSTALVVARTGAPWTPDGPGLSSRLQVRGGTPTTLRVDVHVTSGAAPGRAAPPATAAVDWAGVRERQRATHGRLVRASVLDLAGHEDPDACTEEVWAAARAGEPAARRRAVEIAYLAGRAHAIAATGELPPTLQGVWQGTWRPAWSADYTTNGNLFNGGLASLVPTGTPELATSLLTLVLAHLDDYRENARRVFGADGMLLPARMSTHGRANHVAAAYPHVFWTGCGGWVLRVAADVVATTGDRSLVDDRLWSLVEGVLRFAETATVPGGGRRHLVPGYSPENTPTGAAGAITADATMEVAILRDAARAARLLGTARGDDSLDARWSALAAALPGYRVADDGTLAEWIAAPWRENVAHRHASQLYPLWYEVDPAFLGPAGAPLRAAAAATVRAKIAWRAADPTPPPGRMEMAFGLVQLGLAAAALGDADAALQCVEWLALEHWRPALTTTHDAGAVFNVDASGGLPALVAAMLLGSTGDDLTALPALPGAWPRGEVTGLRARGGVVVDRLAWDPQGCALTLRRLPDARWLAPAGGTRLRAGRPFTAAGRALAGAHLHLSAEPTTVHLTWTGPAHDPLTEG